MNAEDRQRAAALAALGQLSGGARPSAPADGPVRVQVPPTPDRGPAPTTHNPAEVPSELPTPQPQLESRTTTTGGPGAAHQIRPGESRPDNPFASPTFTRDQRGVYYYNGRPLVGPPSGWQAQLRQMGHPDPLNEAARLMSLVVPDAPAPEAPARGRAPAPPGRLQWSVSQTDHARIRPETQALMDRAAEEEEAALRRAQANEVAKAQIQAHGAAREAHLQHEGAVAEDRAVALREQQISERMAAYDDTIQRVQENRIDPEAFFGGDFNRRLGAGILVALGQFASGLGGGENAALGIINRAIDRNVRAQEANQANLRAGAGLEGQALGQFRALLGDEQAAREASRAAHLAAASAQVGSMLARARPEELQGLQRLQAALTQSQQAAQQAAADQARWTSEETSTVDLRTSVSQATRAAFGITQRDLSPEEQAAQRELADRTRAQEATLRSGGAGARRVRRRSARARTRLRNLPPSSTNPFNRVTAEDLEAGRETVRDQQTTASAVAAPRWERFGLVVADPGLVRSLNQSQEERTRVRNAVQNAQNVNRIYDRIAELRRDTSLWTSMTDVARNETLDELRNELANARRIAHGFGTIGSGTELERLHEMVGDPTRSAFRDFITRSDTGARLLASRQTFNESFASELAMVGLELRSADNELNQDVGWGRAEAEESPEPVADEGVSREAGGTLGAWSGAIAGSGLGPLGMLGGALIGGATGAYNAGQDED